MDVKKLDTLFVALTQAAERNLRKDGVVHNVITGYGELGSRCAILASSEPELDFTVQPGAGLEILLLPDPLQAHSAAIREWFHIHHIAIASWVGESWMFPHTDEGQRAAQDWFTGQGPPPSQHPDRAEAVFVSLLAPRQGYARISSRFIARRPHRAPTLGQELSPWAPGPTNPLHPDASLVTSWLEECLPGPEQP